MCYFFLVSLEDFFLSLIFRSLILMYLGMDFFVSVLFEVFLASWICNLKFFCFAKFGNFLSFFKIFVLNYVYACTFVWMCVCMYMYVYVPVYLCVHVCACMRTDSLELELKAMMTLHLPQCVGKQIQVPARAVCVLNHQDIFPVPAIMSLDTFPLPIPSLIWLPEEQHVLSCHHRSTRQCLPYFESIFPPWSSAI